MSFLHNNKTVRLLGLQACFAKVSNNIKLNTPPRFVMWRRKIEINGDSEHKMPASCAESATHLSVCECEYMYSTHREKSGKTRHPYMMCVGVLPYFSLSLSSVCMCVCEDDGWNAPRKPVENSYITNRCWFYAGARIFLSEWGRFLSEYRRQLS